LSLFHYAVFIYIILPTSSPPRAALFQNWKREICAKKERGDGAERGK
jgi:hypothetical protein